MLRVLIDTLRSDGSITINKKLIKEIGILEAVLYSELLSRYCYFAEREQLTEDGYFFNTIADLEEVTGLSGYQQRGIIKKLVALGLILTETRGIPPVRYFKITDKITSILMNSICKETKELNLKKLNSYSKETKELNLKKLNTNNTNIIIQNNNKNKIIKECENKFSHTESKNSLLAKEDIENNLNDKIKETKTTRKNKRIDEMKELIENYTENEKVRNKLLEYFYLRLKKGLYINQLQIILDDLRQYAGNDASLAIDKINTAIAGGYMQIIAGWEKGKNNISFSKPHFDNTAGTEVKKAVVNMSEQEKEEFNNSLARDKEGNLIKF